MEKIKRNQNGSPIFSWEEATEFAKNLQFCQSTEWRLPTREEFVTLAEAFSPCVVSKSEEFWSNVFKNLDISGLYWSSTPYKTSENVWSMYYWSGGVGCGQNREGRNLVQCVRSLEAGTTIDTILEDCEARGTYPTSRFVDLGDRTILDTRTGLIMMQDFDDIRKILELQEDGVSACDIDQLIHTHEEFRSKRGARRI